MGHLPCTFASVINLRIMLESLRKRIAPIFEEPEQEHLSSVKLGRVFLWFMIAGIIGGFAPFIWHINHCGLVSVVTSVIFIILTAKPISKWLINSQP